MWKGELKGRGDNGKFRKEVREGKDDHNRNILCTACLTPYSIEFNSIPASPCSLGSHSL